MIPLWPHDITVSFDYGLSLGWRDPFTQAIGTLNSVTGYSITEVPTGAPWVVAPLDAVLALPGVPAGWQPLAANITYGSVASYTGVPIDPATVEAAGWSPYAVMLHEIGHALGFVDQPSADGTASLYGYADPHPAGFTASDIEFAQTHHGVSADDDLIRVYGDASGRVRGGHGADTISGGDGPGVVYGNQGDDVLFGGASDDTLYGGQDADLLSGGAGLDVVYGNLGDDTLDGGDGFDVLYGGQGDDVARTDADDIFQGGLGADTMIGTGAFVDYDPTEGDLIVPLIGQRDPEDIIHEWSFV